jgi:hypothetical protein
VPLIGSVGSSLRVPLMGLDNAGNSATVDCPYSMTKAATSTQLASSLNPVTLGQAVTLTATISIQSPGAGSITGNVTFMDGTTTLGTGTVSTANGVTTATLSTSSLGLGPHSITAVYGGSTNFGSSTSAGLTQNVDTNLTSAPKLANGAYWLASRMCRSSG